jgi:phosphoglycolate phosphatase
MQYNTVIFDLDGTLLNTLNDLAAAVNHALEECGYPLRTIDEVQSFIGNGIDILMRRAIPSECTDEQWLEARDSFKAYYTKHMLDKTTAYDGIMPLLHALKERGIKTAVVTNKNHDMANQMIPMFFDDLIPCVIGTDLSKRERKPAPDGVFAAIDELGAGKENTIYVGDTEVDVATAHNSGLKCVGVMWGFRCGGTIDGADYIINKPSELLELLQGD